MHRLYEQGDIVVFWNSEKCRHAKRCVNGSLRALLSRTARGAEFHLESAYLAVF